MKSDNGLNVCPINIPKPPHDNMDISFRQKNNNKNNTMSMKVGIFHHGPTTKIVVFALILGQYKLKKILL